MRRPAQHRPNIGLGERTLSAAAGAALLVVGTLGSGRTRALTLVSGSALLYRALSGNSVVYRTLGINRNVDHSAAVAVKHKRGAHFDRSIIIAQPPKIIFECWRNLEDLPKFIDHLHSITPTEGNRSHWVARGPLDVELEWDAEIIDERNHEFFAWRSLPGSEIDTAGSLHLKALSHGRGTDVRLVMKYDPPGGRLTSQLASWLGVDF